MPEPTPTLAPPYATFPSFINFLNKLRETQVPNRIDPSVFGNASGSLSYSIIATLKSLKLINADGSTTPLFVDFVRADDEARKEMLLSILPFAYPTLWSGEIDLTTATAGQFDEHIRAAYDVKGSTVDKVATFFIAAAKFAGLEISPHLAARKPTASSASSGKSKRQRRNGGDGAGVTPPFNPPLAPAEEKALEYQLIDLMKEEGVGEPEQAAIWTLVRYLTTKK